MGFLLTSDGLKPDPKKLVALEKTPLPKDLHELRAYTGFINTFWGFIKNYALHVDILNQLKRKNAPYLWTQHHATAVQNIKQEILKCPTLGYINQNAPLYLYTDASLKGLGAALHQGALFKKNNLDSLRPITFIS